MTIDELKDEIRAKIKTNGLRQISGGITQGVLLDMTDTLAALVPDLDGYMLYSSTVQDFDSLPAAPAEGKYFIFVDRKYATRKYRYIYTCDSGEWVQAFQLWRADLATGESSPAGDVPSLASTLYVQQYAKNTLTPIDLTYTVTGSGATWSAFCSATDPISQEAGDEQYMKDVVNGIYGNNVRLAVGASAYYYLTSQHGDWSGSWALIFGNSIDGGYNLEYDGNDYTLTAL